jgi:tetratricopeptide (TPR) repeat protein
MKLPFGKKRPKVKGCFDGIADAKATGWAFCPDLPDQPLTVEILRDATVIAAGLANVFREDLLEAGAGDGHHAFSIPIDQAQTSDTSYQARVQQTGKILPRPSFVCENRPRGFISLAEGRELFNKSLEQKGKRSGTIKKRIAAFQDGCRAQEKNDFSRTRSIFTRLLSTCGQHAILHCKLGEIAEQSGQWQEALTAYQAASKCNPQFFWAHAGKGRAFQQLGKLAAAEAALAEALVIRPEDPLITEMIASIRSRLYPSASDLPGGDILARAEGSRRLLESLIHDMEKRLQPGADS